MPCLGQRLDRALVLGCVLTLEPQRHEEPVVFVIGRRRDRLAVDGDDATPALAGAFRDELLHPGAERPQARAQEERQLVATRARAAAGARAEPDGEVLL